jgi:hypothetical protein
MNTIWDHNLKQTTYIPVSQALLKDNVNNEVYMTVNQLVGWEVNRFAHWGVKWVVDDALEGTPSHPFPSQWDTW